MRFLPNGKPSIPTNKQPNKSRLSKVPLKARKK